MAGQGKSGQDNNLFQITPYVSDFQTLKQLAYRENLLRKVAELSDNSLERKNVT